MIRWLSAEGKFAGFSYYPLLEMGVGVFLLIMSVVVPTLFLIYNGIKSEQWAELLFCAGFLVLFMFMGKSLTFQLMQVVQTENGYTFFQNMREPQVNLQLKNTEWTGIRTLDVKTGDETMLHLKLKTASGEIEFYKSINRKEINKMVTALEQLRNKAKEN